MAWTKAGGQAEGLDQSRRAADQYGDKAAEAARPRAWTEAGGGPADAGIMRPRPAKGKLVRG